MRHVIDRWDEEAEDVYRQSVWEECVEMTLDFGDEVDLEIMEERFNLLKDGDWFDVDIIMDESIVLTAASSPPDFWETRSWYNLMFVSKHSDRRYRDSVTDSMSKPRSNWLVV
jgi:hypothetical protein